MEKTIFSQLSQVLDILKDYPNIKDIVDLKEAKFFFDQLEKSGFEIPPRFKDIDPTLIEKLVSESKTTIDEWKKKIEEIKGINFVTSDNTEGNNIFWGEMDANLKEFNTGNGENALYFNFKTKNRADFNGKEGTWAEIYLALLKHAKEEFSVPDLTEKVD